MSKIILENSHLKVEILTYGAIIQRLFVKKNNNSLQNVVIGFDTEEEYKKANPAYLGACIGPYAGRIDKGRFPLEDKIIQLDSKDGVHLHGGESGFHMREWVVEKSGKADKPFVTLHLNNKHKDNGYPGNTKIRLTYALVKNELQIHYQGETDLSTLINLTNHSYFNLSGLPITEHTLFINADHYLETDTRLIPTGKKIKTTNSAYDFKTDRKIESPFLDDTFVLNHNNKAQARLSCSETGLKMEVTTDQPGIVIFTPKEGNSICFETQHFPDAPNHPNFPNTVLNPNEVYLQKTAFKFSQL